MSNSTPQASAGASASGGLLRSKTAIAAARGRGVVPSDGGGTGKSDSND
ncbi:hypothetical protein [Streptomyces abikoensis]|uniref:Uncharacterized protein n=1 Tax=Streptomyces abikoensis TaxID=97398 RepID=A0ABW7T9K8_9ACTN